MKTYIKSEISSASSEYSIKGPTSPYLYLALPPPDRSLLSSTIPITSACSTPSSSAMPCLKRSRHRVDEINEFQTILEESDRIILNKINETRNLLESKLERMHQESIEKQNIIINLTTQLINKLN